MQRRAEIEDLRDDVRYADIMCREQVKKVKKLERVQAGLHTLIVENNLSFQKVCWKLIKNIKTHALTEVK